MPKIKDLDSDDQPREKLVNNGPNDLKDYELLAILLRTGVKDKNVLELSKELLAEAGNLTSLILFNQDKLISFKGIGKDKAVTLSAAFEISKRIKFSDRFLHEKSISSPKQIADYYNIQYFDEPQEHFVTFCLNNRNFIIKKKVVAIGGINANSVSPRDVFRPAVECSAKSIIVLHNHPSGYLEPSKEDIVYTRKLIECGKILNILVEDHLIIAGEKFLSFRERGLMD